MNDIEKFCEKWWGIGLVFWMVTIFITLWQGQSMIPKELRTRGAIPGVLDIIEKQVIPHLIRIEKNDEFLNSALMKHTHIYHDGSVKLDKK